MNQEGDAADEDRIRASMEGPMLARSGIVICEMLTRVSESRRSTHATGQSESWHLHQEFYEARQYVNVRQCLDAE